MKEKLKYVEYKKMEEKYYNNVSRIASIRLLVFFVMLFSFILKYYYLKYILSFVFFVSLIIFIILIIIHDKYYKIYNYYHRCNDVIQTYLDRESGEWCHFSDDGSDFLEKGPFYYSDLDIFGHHSLFQYLSICQTEGGRVKLKDRLSNGKYSLKKLSYEQDAISEVARKIPFIIDFSVLLSSFSGKKVNLSKEFSFISGNKRSFYIDFVVSLIFGFVCLILLIFSLLNVISIRYFYGMFLFNFFISYMYSYIYKDEFGTMGRIIHHYRGIREIFNLFIKNDFSSLKMKDIQKNAIDGLYSGSFLVRLDTINSLRDNFISNFLCNGMFGLNVVLLFLFSLFKRKNLSLLCRGISDIEEMEAVCSLANVGVMFKRKCMPVLSEKIELNFKELIHPLLMESVCVANSFDTGSGVNIITGSNMGGKTSFLRTIGVNLILMNSGSFVCADYFSASYFKIFTSMRVNDDIEKGISTFYGELLRIKDMVDYVDTGNMIVFIDEIFKGTNYQDRIYGAREVIKRLNTKQTVVMLTTHDFELCEEKNVCNYHVKEDYDKDRIVFDYKIRKGKCHSTNAKYLMKKLGIIKK